MKPKVDHEIRDLFEPLSNDEKRILEGKLLNEGFRDSLVIWQEKGILLDGHNRLEICDRHGIKYFVQEMSFSSREEAIQWVIDNQLGRRNITDERRAYYIGKEYLNSKNGQGGDRKSKGQSDPLIGNTAESVGAKHGVSPKKVKRDAEYAEAVDKIAETQGDEAKEAILSGESGKTRTEVVSEAKGEEGPVDDSGNPIPKNLLPAFAVAADMERCQKLLTKAGNFMASIEQSDTYKKLSHGDKRRHSSFIKTAATILKTIRPAFVCQECKGVEGSMDNDPCKRCLGLGFLSAEDDDVQ